VTRIRIVYLALGAALGVLLPFGSLVNTAKGFDPIAIGLIGSTGAICGILAAPVWGHLGDVTIGRRRVLQLSGLGAAAALTAYGFVAIPVVLAGLWVTHGLFLGTANPTADAVALVSVSRQPGASFARLRTVLSLAFGAGAVLAGLLYDREGYAIAPFVAAVALVLFALTAQLVDDPSRTAAATAAAGRRGGSTSAAFSAQPRLGWALVTFGLAAVGMGASFNWLPLRIAELGGSPSTVALAAGLESFAEVPAFVVAGFLASRLGLRALYALSAVLMGICVISLALLTDPGLMVAVRMATGVAYSGMTVASVAAIGVLLPLSLQSTGQSLMSMTWSIVSILLGVVGGAVFQLAGAPVLFAASGACTVAAAGLAWFVLPPAVSRRASSG